MFNSFGELLMALSSNKTTDSRRTKVNNNPVVFTLTKHNAWFLWLSQCLNILTLVTELDNWMLGIVALSLLWQALLLQKRSDRTNAAKKGVLTANPVNTAIEVNKVPPTLLALFAILGCLVIVLTAKQSGLLLSMVHLLCFSYALKSFELKTRGDFYQLILLGGFVLASALIFKQNLTFSLIIFTLLLFNFSVLLQFFSSAESFINNLKTTGMLLIQSTILAVVLFLVFPRLPAFWQMPIANSAQTGLSDNVRPGDIAKLTRSTELAFRVDFNDQKAPDYNQLYWRAMVLEDYDGKQWTRHNIYSPQQTSKADENLTAAYLNKKKITAGLTYQVIIEPSYQKYMFALAPAVLSGKQAGIIAMPDYTLLSRKIISQAKSYQLTSYLNEPLADNITNHSREINLRYPKSSNPRLEELATKLKENFPEPQARARAILATILNENYAYTLEPPLLQNNSLDKFFFETKAGFCVHYASAFTFLMRASGVPARMVTGYLGGEYNEVNSTEQSQRKGHMSVYQYDAHAWSEIWLEGKGWLRVDPTSAVDPQRVNTGWSNQLLQQQSELTNDFITLYQLKKNAWLNSLRLQFDALDYQWTRWVIGFTDKRQYDLLNKWFGYMKPWKLALIIAVVLIISMAFLMCLLHFVHRGKPKAKTQAKWQAIYVKALTRLTKLGLKKPKQMTVNGFAKEVRQKYPELAISFTRLSNTYNRLSYQALSWEEQQKLTLAMAQQYQDLLSQLTKHDKK